MLMLSPFQPSERSPLVRLAIVLSVEGTRGYPVVATADLPMSEPSAKMYSGRKRGRLRVYKRLLRERRLVAVVTKPPRIMSKTPMLQSALLHEDQDADHELPPINHMDK